MIVRRVDKINPAFLLCDMKLGGWTKHQSCGKDLILSYGGGLSPSAKFLLESRSPGVSPSKADKKILFCRTEGVYLPPQLLFQTIMRLEQAPALRIKKILFPRTEEVYLPPQRSLITLIWMEQAPALRIKNSYPVVRRGFMSLRSSYFKQSCGWSKPQPYEKIYLPPQRFL